MKKKILKDLAFVLLYTVLFYLIAISSELFESFHQVSVEHERFELDELLLSFSFMSFLLVFFSYRRVRELHMENSKRLETEERLREARNNLEKQVERRTHELVSMNKQLEHTVNILQSTQQEKSSLQQQVIQSQKLESIGVLASGVAHDFNNLLTAINGYADLVMVKTAEYGKDIREDLDKIRNAGEKASNLTKQLLAFSRKQVFNLKPIDINELLNDIVQMASRLIGEHIMLNVQLSSSASVVNADKTQIEQVLMNLLINARDAMPQGGQLTISTSNATLDDDYAQRHEGVEPGKYVLISVSDDGVGVPPDILDKIFDPFFTTKDAGKGTGLGLATVYGIVKQHKGNIWVYSEVGIGTTFKVYLPTAHVLTAEKSNDKETGVVAGSEHILVIDDDEIVREFVFDSLEFHKYTISLASSGKEALEKIDHAEKPFDLFLSDVIMPHMNGWELSEEIRKRVPSAKILFMSGYDDQKIPKDKIEQDPRMSFIPKPLTSSSLIHEIRGLLDS